MDQFSSLTGGNDVSMQSLNIIMYILI